MNHEVASVDFFYWVITFLTSRIDFSLASRKMYLGSNVFQVKTETVHHSNGQSKNGQSKTKMAPSMLAEPRNDKVGASLFLFHLSPTVIYAQILLNKKF